ncbi:hypothetical protein ACFOHY_03080 [Rhizobium rosettiformans]
MTAIMLRQPMSLLGGAEMPARHGHAGPAWSCRAVIPTVSRN